MDIVSLLIILALALMAGAYIANPLLSQSRIAIEPGDRGISSLQAERDRALTALEELDMDHAMGKIGGEDYQDRRMELLAQGAGALRALDELYAEEAGSSSAEDLDAALEAAVARLRATARHPVATNCPRCGEEIKERDVFCARCGEPLRAVGDEP
jgi:hypothetical protein